VEIDDLSLAHAQARHRAEAGDLTGSRTLMEDALAVAEQRLGRDDPRLGPLMVDLATIARNLGNLTEARAQLRRAYAIIVASAGPEHATSLSIEGRLAAVTFRLGEPTEAYDWHLADVGLRVLGPDHPAVRGAKLRLANAPDPGPQMPPVPAPGSMTLGFEDDLDHEPGLAPTIAGYGRGDPPTYTVPSSYEATDYPGVYQRQAGDDAPVVAPAEADPWFDPELPTVRPYRRRGHVGGVALVASLGAAILIAAVVIAVQVFAPGPDPTGAPSPATVAPTTATGAPTEVTIKDDGGSVVLTWADPSDGTVAFVVSGARDGEAFTALESVPPGRTTSVIYGLNAGYNWCFTISAIWAPEVITPSIRTCTNRLPTSRAP
jgi:hypothetical protein